MRQILLVTLTALSWLACTPIPLSADQLPPATAKGGGIVPPPTVPASPRGVDTASPRASKPALSADQRLQRRVQRLLQDDPTTRAFSASATVQNAVVTLTGATYHPEAKAMAERLVQNVAGIRAVRNLIEVEPNADLAIAERLHQEFSRETSFHDASIAVTVIDGRVFLSGTAESTDEANRVTEMARQIPGVRTVSNGLQVAAGSAPRALPGRALAQPYSKYQPRYR